MFWLFYNAVFSVIFLFLTPHFLWRMRRRGGYRKDFSQRFGRYDAATLTGFKGSGDQRPIWVHAVSVGEMQVGFQFVAAMRAVDPDARFVLSCATSTAHALAEKRLSDEDTLIYFPIDWPPIMRRVLDQMTPRRIVLVDTEVWPNLLRLAGQRGIPASLINGRISDRSYRRMQKVRWLTRRVYPMLRHAFMQSEADTQRIIGLGADRNKVFTLSSAKYDVELPDDAVVAAARDALSSVGLAGKRVLLGASTWPGEEALLFASWLELRERFPDVALVLVPRHFEKVPQMLQSVDWKGVPVRCRKEEGLSLPAGEGDPVYVVNTTGEMMAFMAVANWVVVGKSFDPYGAGQNPIEPAALGKPVLMGPGVSNFRRVVDELVAEGAMVVSDQPATILAEWMGDESATRSMGENARKAVDTRRGALAESVKQLGAG